MNKLDKNKVYDLKPLNKEERKVFLQYFKNNEQNWDEITINELNGCIEKYDSFRFSEFFNEWLFSNEIEPNTNAKELFTYHTEHNLEMIVDQAKPKHYSKGIDTFARMEANCTIEECLAFAKGNIDKYNFRTKGQDLEDYKKIVSYANWAIKLLENAKNN